MTTDDLIRLLGRLNQDEVKVYIFKFLHDLHMFFGDQECSNFNDYENVQEEVEKCCETDENVNMPDQESEIKEKFFGTLSEQFYSQLSILKNSCLDFDGIQMKLSDLVSSDNKDVIVLVTMLEYMNPGLSLDLLTLIVICSTVDRVCQKVN